MNRSLNALSVALALCALFLFPMCAKADGKVIPVSKLPAEAQSFIKTHYDGVKVLQVVSDRTDYEVILAGNTQLEFDRSGNWKEIKCKGGSIPDSVIPSRIMSYIQEYFPSDKVCAIERSIWGYEVIITSGFELEFDKNCNFVRIDD